MSQGKAFLFLSAHKHLCFCRLAQFVSPYDFFNGLLNRRKCSLYFDSDLSDISSERDSESDTQH